MKKVWCLRKDTPQALLDRIYFRIAVIDEGLAKIFKETRSCIAYISFYDLEADAMRYLEESYYTDFDGERRCSADYIYMLLVYYDMTKIYEKKGGMTFTDIKAVTPTLH